VCILGMRKIVATIYVHETWDWNFAFL
jgi:hypothetical protein